MKNGIAKWIQDFSMNVSKNTVGKSFPAMVYEERIPEELAKEVRKLQEKK